LLEFDNIPSHGNDGRSDSRAEVVGKEAEDDLDQRDGWPTQVNCGSFQKGAI